MISETFASYAAVAIENTRLYEAAHDQAWISTVLLQVAEATQSLNSMDELLATMDKNYPDVDWCKFMYYFPLRKAARGFFASVSLWDRSGKSKWI